MTAIAWISAALGTLAAILISAPAMARREERSAEGLREALEVAAVCLFAISGVARSLQGSFWAGVWIIVAGCVMVGSVWILSIGRAGPGSAAAGAPARPPDQVDIEEVIAQGEEDLEPGGRALLARLLSLDTIRVEELIVPRDRIVHAELSGGVPEVLERIRESGHLRIPMTDGSLDRIIGIAYAKDLIPQVADGSPAPPLKGRIRRPIFVPKDRSVASVLDIFRTQRGHIAIVVDEYNRTAGLVTRGDIFRRIAGGSAPGTGGKS